MPAPWPSQALWAQPRDAYLHAHPLALALAGPLQRALFDERPAHADPDAGVAAPPFAATRTLALAQPGTRVDHFVRQLSRAHTALALALEQPATALWPLSRRAPWWPSLHSRHHAPLVRARALLPGPALGPRFHGALWFRAEAAPDVVRLWFWAERCGVFPGGLVSVWPLAGGALMLRLCAHGSLHVDAYGAAALEALDALHASSGWRVVAGPCVSAWQPGGAIPGRRLST